MMSKLFPVQTAPLIWDYLLLSVILAIGGSCLFLFADPHIRVGLQTAGVVAFVSTICSLLYWKYHLAGSRLRVGLSLLDRHALPILLVWQVAYLTWCGLVLFANPFRYELNQGDAIFQVQTLWNLVDGLRPESSIYTSNGAVAIAVDPRFPSTYGYVSVFTMHQYWVPMAMLAPLYSLFPHPPMHVFAVQICVIALGLPGMYWAVRNAGAGRRFALLTAIGYSLLPQVGTLLFVKGYMEVMGLAFLPWLFGALFSKKWTLMYVFTLITALISFPFTLFVIIVGLAVLVFYRATGPGIIIVVIGLLISTFDMAVMTTALGAYYGARDNVPSFFESFVLRHPLGSLMGDIKFNILYVAFLLQGMAFLPVIVLWRVGRKDYTIRGLWFIVGLAFIPMMWRSVGWDFQRNAFFIVPAYLLGIASCLSLQTQVEKHQKQDAKEILDIPALLLLFCMTSTILFGNPFAKGPHVTHFPWGHEVSIVSSDDTIRLRATLRRLNEVVPHNASIAWHAGPRIEAFLGNRQNTWVIGNQPEGVKYFAFIGDADLDSDGSESAARWKSDLAKFKRDASLKVIYDANPGVPLLILENLHAHPIPRKEKLLSWFVVLQPILRFWGKVGD